MSWDPERYGRFARERAQPFHDLCDLVEQGATAPIVSAVDLGCGSGELTVLAAERFAIGSLLGVDSSPEMLDAARSLDQHRVRFELGDIGSWTSQADHDLVVANASLQWVPDHPAVLRRWAAALRPGGQLAVQVPSNADHPSHLAAADVAEREPFRSAMDGSPPRDPVAANVLAPESYAELLHDLGFEREHVRLQVYGHLLGSSAEVVEWTRGTTLTRFFDRLPPEMHERFVDAYRTELLARIGRRSPYFYPFKRILMCARSPGETEG
ncbi:trans-aconitate 2-methyltransferase [soil metagenome]